MSGLDLKKLLGKLNRFSKSGLEAASGLSVNRTHYEVTIEHILFKLVESGTGDIALIFERYGVDSSKAEKLLLKILEDMKSGSTGRPVFGSLLIDWIRDAWLLSSVDFGLTHIRSGVLFATLMEKKVRYRIDFELPGLEDFSYENFQKEFFDIVENSVETVKLDDKDQEAAEKGAVEGGALARFTINFTKKAADGEIDPVFGRDNEIRQMVDILARRRKNNPIAVGEPGVGKTAVVEGLALKIASGEVPPSLAGVELLSLDLGLLQAGAGVKGEFENRLKSVISEVKASSKPIILFIDEAHTLVGAGGSAGGSDAANLLKPALARGELKTVAATTWTEYRKYFEKDPALARRFQLVKLDEPSEEDAVTILRGLKDSYEAAHQVYILDSAITSAAKLSNRYISGRQLPDKAVDVLDTAAARVKVGLAGKPSELEDIEITIAARKRELKACKRDEESGYEIEKGRIDDICTDLENLKLEAEKVQKQWDKEAEIVKQILAIKEEARAVEDQEGNEEVEIMAKLLKAREELKDAQGESPMIHVDVDHDTVARVIGDWTGIPLGNMLKDEASSILKFAPDLKKRIKGQDNAVDAIAKGIKSSKSGIGNPDAPIGMFLLVGPSGVGKTESAIGTADILFGGERFMTTINMNEFQEKHTVSKLIGSPPGYVGYGEGGVLTEAVRQRPYSVVLLDEVEKADPEILNLFYQVFDKGSLADGEGRKINFKNTAIFMTSNLASAIIQKNCIANPDIAPDELIEKIRPVLSEHFKPALLARMTIVPYYSIKADAMHAIVRLKMAKLEKRLWSSHRIKVTIDEAVIKLISDRCTEVETGARNIDHILQGNLLPMISTELLEKMSGGINPSELEISIDDEDKFVLNFTIG